MTSEGGLARLWAHRQPGSLSPAGTLHKAPKRQPACPDPATQRQGLQLLEMKAPQRQAMFKGVYCSMAVTTKPAPDTTQPSPHQEAL